MIALLSALVGFLSSAVPEFLHLFRDGRDRAHEITLLKLQMEHDARMGDRAHATRLEEITLAAELREAEILNQRPGVGENKTGIAWVDALAGSVRPMMTYAFFILYFAVKCAQFHLLVSPALPWVHTVSPMQALVSLWTEEDIAIFSAVIGFWFGNRTMVKARRTA